jgi:phosphoribosylaminoimidazole (AIR) synthetase
MGRSFGSPLLKLKKERQVKKSGLTYKDAGVDISEADKFVAMIKERVGKVWPEMAKEIGGFAGSAPIPIDVRRFFSSTDGVGTKLKIAAHLHDYDGSKS